MKLLTFLKLLAMLFAACVVTSPVESVATSAAIDRSNYTEAAVQWRGTLDGQQVSLSGTMEQIIGQIQATHPHLSLSLPVYNVSDAATPFNLSMARSTLDSPGGGKIEPPLCMPVRGQNWKYAPRDIIQSQIYQMITGWGLGGHWTMLNNACGTLSCQWASAIRWCNDSPGYVTQPLPYLATYAQEIIDACTYPPMYIGAYGRAVYYTGGQEFDTARYNVIVQGWDC